MLSRFLVASILVVSLGCTRQAPTNAGEASGGVDQRVLPLVRVRLYASGVGYFERSGSIGMGHNVLPVPAGHLDDALKSLVLLNSQQDLGSISFPSRLSPAVARARAGLPANQEAVLSYDRLLGALRGEEVELVLLPRGKAGAKNRSVRGRVIDVVAVQPSHASYDHGPAHRTLPEGHQALEEKERLQLLLLSEKNQILRLDASQLSSVTALDPIVARRLHAALSARLATRSNQHQVLRLTSTRQQATPIRLAYLAEAPTWRASYRLLLDDNSTGVGSDNSPTKARLQAWALVHNDTDEWWRDVKLELVDGRPNSFLFPITAPRYERRHLETPEQALSSVPQLSTTTPDAMWGDFSDYDGESIARVGSEGLSGVGDGGGGHGSGVGLGRIGTLGAGKTRLAPRHEGSELLWVGDLAQRAGILPSIERATSVYQVESKLQLAPQHSAMVPFMDEALRAAPIVWFDGFDALARRAVGVSNNTHSTLPAGPLAVYGHGGFLGEAMLVSLKPGARQFAEISDEPDAAITAGHTQVESLAQHIDFRGGRLRTHSLKTSTTRLSFDNQSGRPREAYVALPVVLNATVSGSESVDFESTSGRAFAVFRLPATTGHERVLVTREGVSHGLPADQISVSFVLDLLKTQSIPGPERELVRRSLPLLETWQAARSDNQELAVEIEAAEADLERLKTHLKTLGKSESESANAQLMQKILEREEALSGLHAKRRALEKELESQQRDFEATLAELDQFRDGLLEARKRQAAAAAQTRPNGT